MKNNGIIRVTIDFDRTVQSQESARFAVLKALLEWARNEIFAMRSSKGAEIPFEFTDEDTEEE